MFAEELFWSIHLEVEIERHLISQAIGANPMRTRSTDVLYQDWHDSPPQLVVRIGIVLEKRIDSGVCVGRLAIQRQQILDYPLLGKYETLGAAAILVHETDTGLPWQHAVTAAGEEEANHTRRENTTDEEDIYQRCRLADRLVKPSQEQNEGELTENQESTEAEVAGPLLSVPAKEAPIKKDAEV